MSIHICENCSKEHDGSYGSGRFCSDHCRRVFCGKKNINPVNNLPKIPKTIRKSKEGGWKCIWCNEVFRTRAERQLHAKEKHPEHCSRKNRIPWNKGLTMETCESIRIGREKWLKSFNEGNFVCYYGTSDETKRKISEARRKYISEHPESMPYIKYHHSKGESYAERYFRKILEKCNISFKQEVRVGTYSLDFLIGNIDLEIDGEQHYTDKRIIESDKRRTKLLEERGYVVKRVRWSHYLKLRKEERKIFIKELIDFIKKR